MNGIAKVIRFCACSVFSALVFTGVTAAPVFAEPASGEPMQTETPMAPDGATPVHTMAAEMAAQVGGEESAVPTETGPTETGPTETGPTETGPTETGPLRFAVFGDTQDTSPEGVARVRTLITRINALDPAFTVHIGDIKSGGECSDAFFFETLELFSGVDSPLVYMPGDNEWTDCHMESFGAADPAERLDALRRIFFKVGQSLGEDPMPLVQQYPVTEAPEGSREFIENARWTRNGIVFANLHLVGSNNNLRQDRAAAAEHFHRDDANLRWLAQAFEAAEAEQAPALVLFFHANPQWDAQWWQPTGFDRFRAALIERAAAFGKPVLVVHGDTHSFKIDKPVTHEGTLLENLTRLEVFGPPDLGAIEVTVDPSAREVFSFRPFTVSTAE